MPPICALLAALATLTTPSDELALNLPTRIELMPRAVTSFGAAALDGWLYVYGGYFGVRHEYCSEDQSRQFWRFNLRDRTTWELVGDVEALQSVVLVAHDGRLIRAGGMRALNARDDEQQLVSSNEVASFDPIARAWTRYPDLPAPRSSHAAAILDGRLYVVGGWNLGGELGQSSTWHGDACVLDLADTSAGWSSLAVPFQRRGLALAAFDGKLYALGGMDSDEETSTRVDVFDPLSNAWSSGPDLPEHGFGIAACVDGETLISSGASGQLWRCTRSAEAWERAGALAWPRMFHQLMAANTHELLVLGGTSRTGRIRPLEFLNPDGAGFSVEHAEIPAPGAARNRQAWFMRGATLYAFGGNRSVGQHDFTPESFTNEGWAFDLESWSWRALAHLPVARQSLETLMLDGGQGLAFGGFGFDGERLSSHATGFAYDFANDRWNDAGALMSAGRSQFGLAQHANSTWIFGGLDYEKGRGNGEDFVHPLEVLARPLDDATQPFEPSGVALPSPRRAFASAMLGGRFYLVGGLREGFESVAEVDVFDFATRAWSTGSAPSRPRIGAQLVALGERLYLVGGTSRVDGGDARPDRSIEAFDPATGRWSALPVELPFEPQHIRAFAWRERLLVVSTHDAERPTLRLALMRVPASSDEAMLAK